MKKTMISLRLDNTKLDYLDYIARQLDPDKPNRTHVVELLIDMVDGSFTDDMIMLHSQSMTYSDGRKKTIR